MRVIEKTETRVMMVPNTDYTLRFHVGDDAPRRYFGRPAYDGPASGPTPEGFVEDGFAYDNYIAWEETRIVYEVVDTPEPTEWCTT